MSLFGPRPRPPRHPKPADPYEQALALAEQLRKQRRGGQDAAGQHAR